MPLAAPAVDGPPATLDAPALKPDAQTVERLRDAVAGQVTRDMEGRLAPEQVELFQDLMARNRELLRRRNQLEYDDPIASGLKEKLIQAQKQVLALRRSLQVRIDAIEEIQEIEAERRELMTQLQELKDKARAVEEKTGAP